MTQRFKDAMHFILEHEGGYNDIKADSGGATNWGVSLRFLKTVKNGDIDGDGDIDWMDIKKLTKDDAEEIYFNHFWRPIYDMIPEKIGMKVFDFAINAGHSRAHATLQRALNRLGEKLVVDGIVGKKTLEVVNKHNVDKLLDAYCIEQENFYKDLVVRIPKNKIFLKGWINRAKWKP